MPAHSVPTSPLVGVAPHAGSGARVVSRDASAPDSPLVQILWKALAEGGIDPATAIRVIEAGLPQGASALEAFIRHPLPAVRVIATQALQRHRLARGALRFTLLGGFSVTRGTWRADDAAWERRVAQRVVRLLLVHRRRTLDEDEILETFWPDRPADSARRSLHVAICRARRVLDRPGATTVIDVTDRVYHLRLRPGDSVDSDQFETAAQQALTEHGAARVRLLESAVSLWRGEPLPEERYSDWALGWRERIFDLYAAVLAAISDGCLERGDLSGAGVRARKLVELDALNEGGHRRLMVAYARGGQRSQALRQFLACRRALVEQLGVEPATETIGLQQRILAGEPV